jgi:hypothetical protein
MPKFNMSEEDAKILVNYFGAVDRLSNPRLGLDYPYFAIGQREPGYLEQQTELYVHKLSKEDLKKREEQLKPIWEKELPTQESDLKAQIETTKKDSEKAKAEEDKATGDDKKQKAAAREKLEARQKNLEKELEDLKKLVTQPREWEHDKVYATDGYRLIVNNKLCLSCHLVGGQGKDPKGPRLDGVANRLRPEWVGMWIANPTRMLIYRVGNPAMPQNFPKGTDDGKEYFAGDARDRVLGSRDILTLYPKVANMPENRNYRAPEGAK